MVGFALPAAEAREPITRRERVCGPELAHSLQRGSARTPLVINEGLWPVED